MTDGKSRAEIATFDALIADPADKEKMLNRQNMVAQQEISARLGLPIGPPRPPRSSEPPSNGNGKPH